MIDTKTWAESHNIDIQDIPSPVEDYTEPYKKTAGEVASRIIILYGIIAAGHGYDREAIRQWLVEQNIWNQASPNEQQFLLSPRIPKEDNSGTRWLQESQYALLWAIQKVDHLGLPTETCDSIKLIDDIMPEFGGDVESFISTAELRPPMEIRAEEERNRRIYYYSQQEGKEDEVPGDLIYGVLFQRYYSLSWLNTDSGWDDVDVG